MSVCHKLEFCRNGRTNRAGFWHRSFLPPILHCVKRKFGYLWTWKIFLRYIDCVKVLLTYLEKGGCSEHDKLDCRRSANVIMPLSSDARPLVYHSNHQALSAAQFCRTGQLATADTRLIKLYSKMLIYVSTSHITFSLMMKCVSVVVF